MINFFKSLGKGKFQEKTTQENTGSKFKVKELSEGDISLGMCLSCATVVSTEARYMNDSSQSISEQPKVLQRFCTVCNSMVSSSESSQKQINHALENFRENKEELDLAEPENEEISNDEHAKEEFLKAFSPDILSEVGKGDVSVISGSELSSESFQEKLREKKQIQSKLLVSWIKSIEGKIVPCNELLLIDGFWEVNEPSEEIMIKLKQKIIDLSETKNIAIIFILKVK